MILAIARGGLLVAGAIGYALGVKNTFTMNVEFYTGIDERLDMPMILPPVPDLVDFADSRCSIADDVADTGATLELVQGVLRRQGGRGAVRRALREAPLDGPLRVRLAPHRPLDHVPVERGGARLAGASRRGLVAPRKVGIDSALPPAHPLSRRGTLTKRKLALGAIAARDRCARRGRSRSAPSPGSAKSTRAFKAAWIYVGPHNDGGWSQAHDQGRLYVQKMLGSKVQTTYKENVPEGPQVAQVIEQPRPRRQQDHLRDVVRLPERDGRRGEEASRREVRDGDRHDACCRTSPSTTAQARTRSTSPASRPAPRRRPASSATSSRSRSPR